MQQKDWILESKREDTHTVTLRRSEDGHFSDNRSADSSKNRFDVFASSVDEYKKTNISGKIVYVEK